MKAHMVLVVLLLALAGMSLVGRFVLAEPGGQYILEAGRSTSRSQPLPSLDWRVSGQASGGSYSLVSSAVPELRGSGCCCSYLPALLRDAP